MHSRGCLNLNKVPKLFLFPEIHWSLLLMIIWFFGCDNREKKKGKKYFDIVTYKQNIRKSFQKCLVVTNFQIHFHHSFLFCFFYLVFYLAYQFFFCFCNTILWFLEYRLSNCCHCMGSQSHYHNNKHNRSLECLHNHNFGNKYFEEKHKKLETRTF